MNTWNRSGLSVVLIGWAAVLALFACLTLANAAQAAPATANVAPADTLLATYTLWLVAGTVLLALAALLQFELSRRTAMRQLRAYLFLNERQITVKGGVAYCAVQVRNSGQTPASSVNDAIAVWVDSYPVPRNDPPLDLDPDKRATFSMGPGDKYFLYGDVPLPTEQMMRVHKGEMAVWLKGAVHYRDVFNKRRTTHFHACAFGLDFVDDGIMRWMTVLNDGNEAN